MRAPRGKILTFLAIGVVIGSAVSATPVYSHLGDSAAHLWREHIKPKADARYANAVPGTDKARNADKLDGLHASQLRITGHGAGDSSIGVTIDGCDDGSLLSYPIELSGPARIHVDGTSGIQGGVDGHIPSVTVHLLDAESDIVARSVREAREDAYAKHTGGLLIDSGTPYVAPPGNYLLRLWGSTFGSCSGSVHYQDLALSHLILPAD